MFGKGIQVFLALYTFIELIHCEQEDVNKAICVVQYLQQKNLLNSTLLPFRRLPTNNFETSSCGKVIDQELQKIKSEHLHESLSKYNNANETSKYEQCLSEELDRLNMCDKLLKVQFYENNELQKSAQVQEIIDKYSSNIADFCSGKVEEQSLSLFDALTGNNSDTLQPMHPARKMYLNFKESDSCNMDFTSDYLMTDADATLNDNITSLVEMLQNGNETENCAHFLNSLRELFEEEWHILRKFENDDVMQRCFLETLKESNDVGLKLAVVLNEAFELNVDDSEDLNFLREKFILHQKEMHIQSYNCIDEQLAKY